MLRSPFPGHRRYSITHRAVQRLRELVPTVAEEDDEALRDRLDAAITSAEDGGKAVRTLDVMLAEPQILIPLESFGDILYAIIKEDTVVTVLPRGHGEEILQRGQALEQRVAAGEPPVRTAERDEAWELGRRRWRRDVPTPVVERVRSPGSDRPDLGPGDDDPRPQELLLPGFNPRSPEPRGLEPRPLEAHPQDARTEPRSDDSDDDRNGARLRPRLGGNRLIAPTAADRPANASVATVATAKKPSGPVAEAIARGLALGRRRAAAQALGETLRRSPADAPLLPLWNLLAENHLPEALTIGDLVAAVRGLPG
jgi:hypothetical protein